MPRAASLVPAVAAGGAVVALAAADGGYFPTAWGWAALVPLLAAGAALATRDAVRIERLDAIWLGALAALAAWIGLSALWAPAIEAPLLELERALVPVAVAAALLLLCDRRAVPALLAGTLGGIAAVAVYALGTRLAPDRLGSFDPSAGYQLAEPIGYWNALGLLAALGVLLALGCAAAATRPALRAAAAAPLPLLACTLLFTYGRGAWLALAAGLFVAAALHPARLRLAALGLALAPVPALAVWLCSRPDSLNAPGATLDAAARDGHRLALVLAVLTALEAGIALATTRVSLAVGRRARIALAAVLIGVAVAGLALVLARVGSPLAAFTSPVPATEGDLGRRLFSASGNGRSDYWRIALEQARDEPLLGGGAGSYERRWLRDRPTAFAARDAHSLELETLAELGPLGLALLLVVLGVPLVALARARRDPLAVAAGSAYAAWLAHSALDWDWEMPAVTVPALVAAGAVVLAARRGSERRLGRGQRIAGLAAIAAAVGFLFVMHAGNTALAASAAALERGDAGRAAAEARAARRWLPWAAEPWQRLADAELAAGRLARAVASYHEALERDRESWELWYGLAAASSGPDRERALARARALNPHSPELGMVRNEGQ